MKMTAIYPKSYRHQFTTQKIVSKTGNIMFTSQWSLEINCGFARAAIRELTPTGGVVDTTKRAKEFRALFEATASYGLPSGFFDARKSNRPSIFDDRCGKMLTIFSKKWRPTEARPEYLATLSIQKWKVLSLGQKAKHTLSNCNACYQQFQSLQLAFPGKPCYIPEPDSSQQLIESKLNEIKETASKTPETTTKAMGSVIVSTLDPICRNTVGVSIGEVLAATPKSMLQARETPQQKKQKSRKVMRSVQRQLGVLIRWTGMDHWTGTLDYWNGILDYWNGILERPSTHCPLYFVK